MDLNSQSKICLLQFTAVSFRQQKLKTLELIIDHIYAVLNGMKQTNHSSKPQES